ncbi:C-type mannose receptor 2-like isoform X2 [Mizuhopecten yessoensis]|uniref:C-type mannose receptor 2-like isoform X2 n=1 Tax=Mizuhopecten yessoensis TaxID=6573 RepID=UPI000B458D98|nr:C-type mannose receptor 2-like isoform X2 [Mizuhopecten yessoensis]
MLCFVFLPVSCGHIDAYVKHQVVLVNAQCYHLAQDAVSWNDAVTRCRLNNGTLASIPDLTVNTALIKLSTNLDYSNLANVSFYWIGGKVDSIVTGVTWLRDPGTGFVAFNDGEPQGSAEFGCLMLDPGAGGWATDMCVASLELAGYICEYPGKERALPAGDTPQPGSHAGAESLMEAGVVCFCITIAMITRRLGEQLV